MRASQLLGLGRRFENLEPIFYYVNYEICERYTESVRFKKCTHDLLPCTKSISYQLEGR